MGPVPWPNVARGWAIAPRKRNSPIQVDTQNRPFCISYFGTTETPQWLYKVMLDMCLLIASRNNLSDSAINPLTIDLKSGQVHWLISDDWSQLSQCFIPTTGTHVVWNIHTHTPVLENPSWAHTTPASLLSQKSSHTVPHVPLRHTSTRPSLSFPPFTNLRLHSSHPVH